MEPSSASGATAGQSEGLDRPDAKVVKKFEKSLRRMKIKDIAGMIPEEFRIAVDVALERLRLSEAESGILSNCLIICCSVSVNFLGLSLSLLLIVLICRNSSVWLFVLQLGRYL